MKTSTVFSLLCFLKLVFAHIPVLKETDDGFVITGRGCGILEPIKYLTEIPEDLEANSCSIITPKSLEELNKDSTTATSTTMWLAYPFDSGCCIFAMKKGALNAVFNIK